MKEMFLEMRNKRNFIKLKIFKPYLAGTQRFKLVK